MIQARAEQLVKQLDEQQRLLRERNLLTAFKSRRQHLMQWVATLGETMKTVRVLRNHEIGDVKLQQDAQSLLNMVQAYQQRFVVESEWITEQNSLDQLKHSLDSFHKKLSDMVKKHWRSYVDLNLPPLSEDVLQVLERIPSYSNEVALIRRTYREMWGQKEQPPKSDAEVQAFLSKRVLIETGWERLGNGEFPPDVLQFLKASSSVQGSPLQMLTPGVLEWLTEHNLLSIFRIRVSN